MNPELIIALLAATIQAGTPILYATLGEIVTERAGVMNLGVEGLMMVGALSAYLVAQSTGDPWLGFAVGGLGGMALAAIHGLLCVTLRGNQVVSGLALTIFGVGAANFWGAPYLGKTLEGFQPASVPYLQDIPVLGPIFFQQDHLVYFSYFLPPLIWLLLRRTRLGLRLRAVGENPSALNAAGGHPGLLRWFGVLAGGYLAGLGGAYLPLAYTHIWTNFLTAGRGWIAVALVIFAFWRPGRAVFGAYLFGGVMAFQLRVQAVGTTIPSSLLQMLPYVLTVIVLVVSSATGKAKDAPAGLGVNIEPEA